MKFTVAIPTYKRPEYLKRAVESVLAQSFLPDELLLVSRVDDEPTNEALQGIISKNTGPVIIRKCHVAEPGFLPPVRKAIESAQGDVLVLLDDDAEAHPDWLQRISVYYHDPKVGGVGGRYINYFSGILQHYPPVEIVAKLYWYGRSVGNMYCDCTFLEPIEADFLIGGNLSYRLEVLRKSLPDARLGNNVAFHWEMDVGQQVKHHGFRILFDPAIQVDHHTAPREIHGMRTVNYEGTYWSNYNYAYLMRKHLSPLGFAAYLIYSFLLGGSGSPGLAYVIYAIARGRPIQWRNFVLASLRGRLDGVRA